MNDLTTNETVLEALEIAPVKWEGARCIMALTPWADGKVYLDANIAPGSWRMCGLATPADLDHAIPVWLEKLEGWGREKYGKEFGGVKLWLEPSGNWYCAVVVWVDDGEPAYRICESSKTLIGAVASAVVKVGKPKENENVCAS